MESLGLATPSRARLASELKRSEQALAERDAGWFARRLPNCEHWRLYPTFAPETAYLDIETRALSVRRHRHRGHGARGRGDP